MKKLKKKARRSASGTTKGRKKPELIDAEERILREAVKYLLFKHGHLLVPTDIREEAVEGARRWIITVTLRYPTGHEGYIGDLLYDGKDFSFLTPLEVRVERARQIEADPALQREWDEYQASTFSTRKA